MDNPYIIGWDFPQVSQEQRNVFHMRGYGAALIFPDGQDIWDIDAEIVSQDRQNYITITLEEGKGGGEFDVIPNAYKALLTYMSINRIKEKQEEHFCSSCLCSVNFTVMVYPILTSSEPFAPHICIFVLRVRDSGITHF